jgi:hypothetical protein
MFRQGLTLADGTKCAPALLEISGCDGGPRRQPRVGKSGVVRVSLQEGFFHQVRISFPLIPRLCESSVSLSV